MESPRERRLRVDGAAAALLLYDDDEQAVGRADAVLLVFAVSDRGSCARLGPPARGLRSGTPPAPLILVGNKSDLARARQVSPAVRAPRDPHGPPPPHVLSSATPRLPRVPSCGTPSEPPWVPMSSPRPHVPSHGVPPNVPVSPSPPPEARGLAAVLGCHHIETSAALRHRTEELFQAAVRQARLHRRRLRGPPDPHGEGEEEEEGGSGPPPRRRRSLTGRAKRFFTGLVPLARQRSKSCSDLSAL
ncbi:GTP-binding protein REM 2 [Ciconia boyciana]|uniref:GTP-binding protein REM 2 n=1 Tax=Ciconia boyciana TaxID=52775 RepID=UPI003B9EB643